MKLQFQCREALPISPPRKRCQRTPLLDEAFNRSRNSLVQKERGLRRFSIKLLTTTKGGTSVDDWAWCRQERSIRWTW